MASERLFQRNPPDPRDRRDRRVVADHHVYLKWRSCDSATVSGAAYVTRALSGFTFPQERVRPRLSERKPDSS
jgi:hypothetical protein